MSFFFFFMFVNFMLVILGLLGYINEWFIFLNMYFNNDNNYKAKRWYFLYTLTGHLEWAAGTVECLWNGQGMTGQICTAWCWAVSWHAVGILSFSCSTLCRSLLNAPCWLKDNWVDNIPHLASWSALTMLPFSCVICLAAVSEIGNAE